MLEGYEMATRSRELQDQAYELRNKRQYPLALKKYKEAYKAYPDNPYIYNIIKEMAETLIVMGDYETSLVLSKVGLRKKLYKEIDRLARFYDDYLLNRTGSRNPESGWFYNATVDFIDLIGLNVNLIEKGSFFIDLYYKDFNDFINSILGEDFDPISDDFLEALYREGNRLALDVASELFHRYIRNDRDREEEMFFNLLDDLC